MQNIELKLKQYAAILFVISQTVTASRETIANHVRYVKRDELPQLLREMVQVKLIEQYNTVYRLTPRDQHRETFSKINADRLFFLYELMMLNGEQWEDQAFMSLADLELDHFQIRMCNGLKLTIEQNHRIKLTFEGHQLAHRIYNAILASAHIM